MALRDERKGGGGVMVTTYLDFAKAVKEILNTDVEALAKVLAIEDELIELEG